MAGPSFEDGFNLPGAADLSVRVVKNAQDNQEELVMGDTPPGPGPAGLLTDSHEMDSGDGILDVPVFSGSRRESDLHEKISCDGILAVPVFSGFRRESDLHEKLSCDGILAVPAASGPWCCSGPGFAGLRGRRASRAARRVQISESSLNRSSKCVDSAQSRSFSDNFLPHRRVISCDNDLLALDLLSKSSLVSDSRVSGASFVSRPVGCVRASVLSGVSARCVGCGCSLDGSDASRCRVCAEDACGVMANSGSDHIDRNSWKHGPEVSGGTKTLNQCSGTKDGRSFVDTVVGGAALAQYLRGAPEGTKVEAWEGRIFTCSRPTSWDVSVAEGCQVTVSAVYLPKKRPGPPAARASLQDFIWLVTVALHCFLGNLDLPRCSQGFAGYACSRVLF